MRFRFTGSYGCEAVGLDWAPGQEHDIEDAATVAALDASPVFERVDGTQLPLAPMTVKE